MMKHKARTVKVTERGRRAGSQSGGMAARKATVFEGLAKTVPGGGRCVYVTRK